MVSLLHSFCALISASVFYLMMRMHTDIVKGVYMLSNPAIKEDIQFVKNTLARMHTQVWVRADIVKGAGSVLAKAATISTRYASVRRQTAPAAGQPETQVCVCLWVCPLLS